MSRTISIRNHPAVVIATVLLAAGSAAVVADGAIAHNPGTGVEVRYTQPSSQPQLHGLTPLDRKAAQRLADLRAQWAADLACSGPAYPARPC